ncbi:efflux RND transporter permease subunit [Candidatus Lariskella endosymbiont of Epinotia ramella]|uniref:efflux RND transporter permease subunit n=1 Tax=Candidatus Lariskella endosymbiont of Epinotia ramella TaxID=3066224 RepID=UPI0030CBC31E
MGRIIQSFVDRKRASIMLLIMVALCGYVAFLKIPKESNPDVKVPMIYVLITYEGISPEDGQRLLLKPMENALRNISGIKEMTAYAMEGSASIIVEFEAGKDVDQALTDVRNEVNDHEHELPTDADRPIVKEVDLSLEPVLNVILLGDIPDRTLLQAARDLKDAIENVQGVLDVNIRGDREEALEIIVEPKVLENYGLPLQLLGNAVDSNNQLVPAGTIQNQNGSFPLKIPSLVKDFHELMEFPVFAKGDMVLKLKDIAEVRNTYKDIKNTARVNGKSALVLEISKRTGYNIILTVEAVKAEIDNMRDSLPNNLEIVYSQDKSDDIKDILSDLENTILIASILVVIVIMKAVGTRASFLIAFSIPSSFLSGILILQLMGYTLNIVVLFSLILTVGMIVDDAIVVSEYADRKIIEGAPLQEAFTTAATRMFWPIFTSTLVKIIVFSPLLFWPGVLGQFMQYLPITAIFILGNSLLFALFFQPSLGPLFGKSESIHEDEIAAMKASEEGDMENLGTFSKLYMKCLLYVLDHAKIFVYAVIAGIIGVYIFFFKFGTGIEFFPKIEPSSAVITIGSPGNISITQADEIMKRIEEKVVDMSLGVKIFYVKAGNVNDNNQFPEDTIGVIEMEFDDWKRRPKAEVIIEEIKKRLDTVGGVSYQVLEERVGPPSQKPIEIDFSAPDYDKLLLFVDKFRSAMDEIGGMEDIEDSRPVPAIEWHLLIDREKAAKYSVDVGSIGSMLRLLTDGVKISSYRPDDTDDEVDIMVRLPKEKRFITTIESLKIVNTNGVAIPLNTFVKRIPDRQVSQIKRVDKKNVITVKANVEKGVLADTKVKELGAWFKQNAQDGVKVKFKGDNQDQQETGTFLINAFVLALFAMFIVMLIQFNSFYQTLIVMSAVFLSTVGVLLGLLIAWQPFGVVMCGIGIIALSGIVLNNNIIFVDTYQHLRRDGFDVKKAVITTGVQRLRPICLTASTAILGLVPMVLGITINFFEREITYDAPASQWWRQLSTAIAGGLAFATVLTLFFTPCLLLLLKKYDSIGKKSES